MRWFGDEPFSNACHPSLRVVTEEIVGSPCGWCDEEIGLTDQGYVLPSYEESPIGPMTFEVSYHLECHVRSLMGSVGHQRRCRQGLPCDPDGECNDDEYQTKREAAYAAFMYATEGGP